MINIREDNLEEVKREVTVVRKGKVVKKKVDITKIPKRMSLKKQLALKKARRKAKTKTAMKKRKKSMKIRDRRISDTKQAKDAQIVAQRREKSRKYEDIPLSESVDAMFVSEYFSKFEDIDGIVYAIKEGYFIDVYEDDNVLIADIYDDEGEEFVTEIPVSWSSVSDYIDENFLKIVPFEEIEFFDDEEFNIVLEGGDDSEA